MWVAPNAPARARAMPSRTRRKRSASLRPHWRFTNLTRPALRVRGKNPARAAISRLDEPVRWAELGTGDLGDCGGRDLQRRGRPDPALAGRLPGGRRADGARPYHAGAPG